MRMEIECLNTEIIDTLNSETQVEGKGYRLSVLGTERAVSHPLKFSGKRKQNLGMFQVYAMLQKSPTMKKRW